MKFTSQSACIACMQAFSLVAGGFSVVFLERVHVLQKTCFKFFFRIELWFFSLVFQFLCLVEYP